MRIVGEEWFLADAECQPHKQHCSHRPVFYGLAYGACFRTHAASSATSGGRRHASTHLSTHHRCAGTLDLTVPRYSGLAAVLAERSPPGICGRSYGTFVSSSVLLREPSIDYREA